MTAQQKNNQGLVNQDRSKKAEKLIKKYAFGSGVFGYIPVPVVDALGIMTLQRKMLFHLASVYKVPFSRSLAKDLLKTLAGGIASQTAIPMAIKMVPGINILFGSTSMAAIGSASTYAVGKVFQQHFEEGGTLEDFDPEEEKEIFKNELKKGVELSQKKKH
jgi:uncharacterized protein (DUF697 family)